MRVAALVKQIPAFESMALSGDGRLVRHGLPLEMSAYCRRAVAQATALVGDEGGELVVITMGPPFARDVLREALAHADLAGIAVQALLLCDEELAGSDTLATAEALAAVVRHIERAAAPFDLILCGRNSVDADTGQVPPELAALLDRPFLTGVKQLELTSRHPSLRVRAGCELDDTWEVAEVTLPAVFSTAERLIDPCKIKDPELWGPENDARISVVTTSDLGAGPWGHQASPTTVGVVRAVEVNREAKVLGGPIESQVREVVQFLARRGLLARTESSSADDLVDPEHGASDTVGMVPVGGRERRSRVARSPVVAVVVEPGRERLGRELAVVAARLAEPIQGVVHVIGTGVNEADASQWARWGADHVVTLRADEVPSDADWLAPEDVAVGLEVWTASLGGQVDPWAVLVGGTPWGREVASRLAVHLRAGLTGDAVGLEVEDGRLVAWKPAFGGAALVAIHCSSATQMATVRLGVFGLGQARDAPAVSHQTCEFVRRGRVRVIERRREDDTSDMVEAARVIGIGQGVAPERYGELDELRQILGAVLGATRKVTDMGWLPHARQLGITGHSIAPELFVAIGTSGKYNHMVGVREAGTIVAINSDAAAPLFAASDIGIVGDWGAAVAELVRQLRIADGAESSFDLDRGRTES